MKDRIAQIMYKEGLSATQFADKIGISASSLSHILNGRNNPSLDVVMRIHKAFDRINMNWLIYGTGSMEELNNIEKNSDNEDKNDGENLNFLSGGTEQSKNRKEIELGNPQNPTKETVIQEIKYVEKPARKITEIRIFFDNGTYETFKPA